ncbi:exodeoxyribonuclease VII small subunit [uncultured Treponema sp.]|uniref:exodeoxyribonuclease VII small subunit n=1 Tax=uncultured Treponema sp. TaxID=162155 RepID=UPI0025FDF3B8|nr:exodeoxyribonuclease VII small subunit [uncultured Treponema sp.]
MKSFEENLSRLEELTANIRKQDISLEDALANFEEGIKLAKTLEKDIEKIEGKIQILMNQPVKANPASPTAQINIEPQLDLFSGADSVTGSAGAPQEGLRQ